MSLEFHENKDDKPGREPLVCFKNTNIDNLGSQLELRHALAKEKTHQSANEILGSCEIIELKRSGSAKEIQHLDASPTNQLLENLAASIVIGAILARYAPATGLMGTIVRGASTAMGISFYRDLTKAGTHLFDTVSRVDGLSSRKLIRSLATDIEARQFLIDTAVMTIGSLIGQKLGRTFLQCSKITHLAGKTNILADSYPVANSASEQSQQFQAIFSKAHSLSNDLFIAIPHLTLEANAGPGAMLTLERRNSSLGQLYLSSKNSIVQVISGDSKVVTRGTGFFVDEQGLLFTNNHVIDGIDHIKVKTANGEQYFARLMARDKVADVALLQVLGRPNDMSFSNLSLAPGSSLNTDAVVATIGHPRGVTQEVLSLGNYKETLLESRTRLSKNLTDTDTTPRAGDLMTTAPVQPGSSGSPLLSEQGLVVGIVKRQRGEGSIATTVEHLRLMLRETKENPPISGWYDFASIFERKNGSARAYATSKPERMIWPDQVKSTTSTGEDEIPLFLRKV